MQKKLLFMTILFASGLTVFGQSGGTFEIRQSVVASGGESGAGGSFTVNSTVGQAVAGGGQSGGQFAATSGFWTFAPLAPTAANASISGRITTADGRGIRNVIISLTDISGGTIRMARSSSFGYYRFVEIPVGETYILQVSSKSFVFLPDTRIITLLDELADIDFTAQPQK